MKLKLFICKTLYVLQHVESEQVTVFTCGEHNHGTDQPGCGLPQATQTKAKELYQEGIHSLPISPKKGPPKIRVLYSQEHLASKLHSQTL